MGVYDKLEFNLECKDCGAQEQIIFLDQGVGWGFPEWMAMTPASTKFNAVFIDGEVTKPQIEVTDCKACKSTNIEIQIG